MQQVRDYSGVIEEKGANEMAILFKHVFKVDETTHCWFRLVQQSNAAAVSTSSEPVDLSLLPSATTFVLRVVNNDTLVEVGFLSLFRSHVKVLARQS